MTREECLERIAELQKQVAEGRARIAVREADLIDAFERQSDASLLYRRIDNALQAPAAGTDITASSMAEGEQYDWSGWEKWLRGHIMNERQVMAYAIGQVVAETSKEMREERARELAERDAKIARLEGKVEALLTLLGQKELKSVGRVIDLPAWRAKDVG